MTAGLLLKCFLAWWIIRIVCVDSGGKSYCHVSLSGLTAMFQLLKHSQPAEVSRSLLVQLKPGGISLGMVSLPRYIYAGRLSTGNVFDDLHRPSLRIPQLPFP